MVIQVKEVESRRGGFPDGGWEHRWLQGGQWGLKLGGDEGQGLVLHLKLLVELHGLWDERGVKLEERVVEERREVTRHLLAILEAALHAFRERLRVGHVGVLAHLGLLVVQCVHFHVAKFEQPLDEHVGELGVLVLVEPRVLEHMRTPDNTQAAAGARLVQRAHGPVEGKGDGPAGEHGERGLLHRERGAVRVSEGQAGARPRVADGLREGG
mmetsp:Transcript_8023/g.22067  ORF Transcript_8023/g.22067 Transcript_8023/m.22067 type:complete len:212 (+) Transcript_8023:666-1301(+)